MKNLINDFKDFNEKISSFRPYDYQSKVAEHLLNCKNVILSVPTGAGKTWASIMPFLFAKNRTDIDFPKKMIYSLPLRALCNSISEDVNKAIENTDYQGLTAIQTGEFSEDKYFEKGIIFSTIDQTLSNFLCFPLPLSQRQANVNAGALIGSYLVFDEFHLLDGERSMATTLGMLRMLGKLSRFCIMTATLSDDFMNKLKGALNNVEIVTLDSFDEDKKKIGSLKPKDGKTCKKEIEVAEGIIKADKIKEFHDDKTIVICNRVETAQRVYLELEDWAKEKGIKLICLHSRFFDRHRKATEKQLKLLFGKDVKDEKTNSILISTQVIEAGMDISCEVMHTEIAPINALLQRVGRCARYTGEYGKVFVYHVLEEEEKAKIEVEDFNNLSKEDKAEIRKLKNKYLPYDEALCKVTLEKLKLPENQQLSEAVTIRLVNEILTSEEQKTLQQLQTSKYNWGKIKESWRDCSKSHYRQTVRDIQSANAVIIQDKSFAERFPYSLEDIGMFKWSLVKWIKEVLETVDTEEDWVIGIVEESNIIGFDLDESDTNLTFREITDIDEVIKTFDTLYLNAKYFHYDKLIGFNKERGSEYSNFKERKNKEKELFGAYRKDTFIQHTKGLLGAFEKEFLPSMAFPFKHFNQTFGTDVDFKELVQLVLILHDYGKLDNSWQDWMQEYQEELSKMPNSPYTFEKGIPLGHTGFNTREEKDLFDDNLEKVTKAIENKIFKKRGKRPPHAGVGAKVITDILLEEYGDCHVYDDIAIPASIAIARHHGVTNFTYPSFTVSNHNFQYIRKLLAEFSMSYMELEQYERKKGELEVMDFDQYEQFLLYLFLVRILRLCDQKATDDFEKYLN
ncbi:MAG: CRISPR-associated helicase Cas3' [Chitinophagales bacterium]